MEKAIQQSGRLYMTNRGEAHVQEMGIQSPLSESAGRRKADTESPLWKRELPQNAWLCHWILYREKVFR